LPFAFCLLTSSLVSLLGAGQVRADAPAVVRDGDSDCLYVPNLNEGEKAPALLVLSCTGATERDLDSNLIIADSLGWILASCHGSRNHRSGADNDRDIMKTLSKLLQNYPVMRNRVYICGFSGMGGQSIEELVLHPELFRGAVTSCTPFGGDLPTRTDISYTNHAAYLVSREQDWNLQGNQMLREMLVSIEMATTLVVTPGKHEPGGPQELLTGCRWVLDNTP
jgi:hypothetical protein